jgi:hypothetical protein
MDVFRPVLVVLVGGRVTTDSQTMKVHLPTPSQLFAHHRVDFISSYKPGQCSGVFMAATSAAVCGDTKTKNEHTGTPP